MNTQPLEKLPNIENTESDTEELVQCAFTQDEIRSLLSLRQRYQNGGSDRAPIVHHLQFLKLMIANGKIEL